MLSIDYTTIDTDVLKEMLNDMWEVILKPDSMSSTRMMARWELEAIEAELQRRGI